VTLRGSLFVMCRSAVTLQLLSLGVVLALSTASVHAQSVDVFAERVSMDMNMLSMLKGQTRMGQASVWPVAMTMLDDHLDRHLKAETAKGRVIDSTF
jgi:hypothetical protein